MNALRAVLGEVWGLFVDDGALVILSLLWIAVAGWLLPLVIDPFACAVLLFLGLAASLAYSVWRT